ncbi:hypothetical protein N7E02_18355 [Aliirhizobium terrae]|uniref:hypothetical protein n=1 Tax=Terrirhizobium terrae TaxID=2926709 RepID=UPI0025767E04|nr:hypothetical protein [Rhizobium sp. CC-CFT758]WJH38899.1 hypothetical protein N7E02_18355 [Rhizobium sp. CC-CFT758]
MNFASYPAPSAPNISLPRVSILGQPPLQASVVAASADHDIDAYSKHSQQSPASIMVGLDDKGKPHASWFAASHADAARRAADLMGMALIRVTKDIAAIAAALPQGKLFESGKAFVPFVKRSTYDLLAAHLSDDYLAAAAQRVDAAAASADYAKASKGEVTPRSYPGHWSKIAVGDIVLASEGHDDGWWEATVVGVQDSDNYLLAWSDWPELDQFIRHVTQLALLHPKFTSEASE